jgi:hypothetical protein
MKLLILKREVATICQTVNSLEPRLLSAEAQIVSISNDLSSLKTASSTVDLEDLCAEVADRSARQSNIVLYNVPESKSNSAGAKTTHDRDLIGKIFRLISCDVPSFSFFRIGKSTQRSVRPIKVIFPNADVVKDFFKRFSKELLTDECLSEVTASRDRTPKERNHLAELRKQLQDRMELSEVNLTIRYINGTPKIVTKAKN